MRPSPCFAWVMLCGLFALLFFIANPTNSNAAEIYVKADAAGLNNGTSWTDAYTDLQGAITAAVSGDDIWVAVGTYKPTPGTDRAISFWLKTGVGIYGGFDGTETSLGERDFVLNTTILSGDLGVADDYADNSYHVLRGDTTDATAILDGFTVTAGAATLAEYLGGRGGGLLITNLTTNTPSSPTIANVIFDGNIANDEFGSGGAVAMLYDVGPTFTNVEFRNNSAYYGGALFMSADYDFNPEFTSVLFEHNSAVRGGAVYQTNTASIFTDAVFDSNTSTVFGGAMHVSGGGANFVRVDFTNNRSSQGGAIFASGGVSGTDVAFDHNIATFQGGAIFVSHTYGDLISVTYTNNSAPSGGAIYVEGYTTDSVVDSYFGGNSADFGGAIYLAGGGSPHPLISNVTFESNSATKGGAIYNARSAEIIANEFIGNTATVGGGAIYNASGDPVVSSCLFRANTSALNGGAVYNFDSAAIFSNATFSNNTALGGSGGALHNDASTPTITNSILFGDSAVVSGPEISNVNASVPVISYSLIEGSGGSGVGWDAGMGTDGGDNIDADPQFVSPVGGNYRLSAGSPCIENGDNAAPGMTAEDLVGNARIRGLFVDMGAYESPYFCPADPVLFVDDDAVPPGSGASWSEAYPNLNDAFAMADLCPNVTEIWVAEGTYQPLPDNGRSATFTLRNGLSLYGGFEGNETSPTERKPGINLTVLSGEIGDATQVDNLYHVVTGSGTDSTAVLDGFVVTLGAANGSYPDDRGGGMYNVSGSPTVMNVIFEDNSASFGGAMSNFIGSDITLVNIVFDGNTAMNSGGAVSNTVSAPVFTNATFHNNSASSGGAMYNNNSSPTIVNTIFFGDDATTHDEVYNTGTSAPVISYSLVEGSGGSGGGWNPAIGVDGGNNIDDDPLFKNAGAGDLRLLNSASPAYNAGDNFALHLAARDVDGKDRILDGVVDIGAYEFMEDGTGIGDGPVAVSAGIQAVYPNPFNPTVTVEFALAERGDVRVAVYDVEGKLVRVLHDGAKDPGPHRLTWDARDGGGQQLASGVYFIEAKTTTWRNIRKIVLLK